MRKDAEQEEFRLFSLWAFCIYPYSYYIIFIYIFSICNLTEFQQVFNNIINGFIYFSVESEKAIEKLDTIVKSLEDKTISLDESLKLYESGISLINSCNNAIEEAKKKIEELSEGKVDLSDE